MKTFKLFIGLSFLLLLGNLANAQDMAKAKVGISGYDPVAYFTQGEPAKGDAKFQAVYQGTTYYFANKSHLKKFQENPSKYAPQYDGWCAYGIAKGGEFPINPNTFKIVDGKLYLFYNSDGTNTLTLWNKDEKTFMTEADKKWKMKK